jgi:sterol 3beta-glucosyltransferase
VATGYRLREQSDNTEPVDAGLEGFVAAGAPPVYVGFGSSVGPDPARLGAAVSDAVRQAGIRAVIASGWGRPARRAPRLRRVGHRARAASLVVPPCCRGRPSRRRGDDRAGLLAARPTVVCPFQGDQHFWGAAVHRAGAGPPPQPAKKLSSSRLASAIRTAIDDSAMHARTAELSARIAQEDGATRASEQIERTLA